jgi:Spy/CpxP family protein refolding chaperone
MYKEVIMKVIGFVTIFTLGLLLPGSANAHNTGSYGDFGMMGHHMGSHGMYGYNVMNKAGCPMVSEMGPSADYLLDYKDELDLSKTQVSKLKTMRDEYQKSAVELQAQLQSAMYKLHNLLSEDELNTVEIRTTNGEIERIENELRTKNIETYISAKLLLTRDQLDKVNDLGIFDIQQRHHIR